MNGARAGWRRGVAAATAGLAVGVAGAAGVALLLYRDRGMLVPAGFLTGLALLCIGAGVWAGAGATSAGRRGLTAIVGFTAAAVIAYFWTTVTALQTTTLGPPLAVVLLLAEPMFAGGALLASLGGRNTPMSGLLAGGLGVMLATAVLIPHLPAVSVYLIAAVAVAVGMLATGGTRSERMRGQRVIITGVGGRGQVGYALAEAFLAEGARLVITGHSTEVGAHARELSAKGVVTSVVADLTQPADADRVVAMARERLGGLDALVNAVGGLRVIRPLAETSVEEWDDEIDRNARTTFVMCTAALPLLRQSRGAIVNFAAPAGLEAGANVGAYSAGKAGVIAVTQALAKEEKATGVRVNAVAPGMVDTEQNRGEVEDPSAVDWVTREQIAALVVFLAGPASGGVTGEVVRAMGGVRFAVDGRRSVIAVGRRSS
jgi:NAD(P)-dependent dehydrogenase (short-subunit alcohol dehydrogenase family)